MSNEEQDAPPTPYPSYVIRSCELTEMSSQVQDNPPYPSMSLGVVSYVR